jgi:hypothetical protein
MENNMSETIHNSPGLDFYNETIAELSVEKKRLESRLQLLQTEKVGPGKLTYCLGAIFSLLMLYGLIIYLFPDLSPEMSASGPYYFTIFAAALLFTIYYVIKKKNNTGVNKIANRICEIEREIAEKKDIIFKSNSDQVTVPPVTKSVSLPKDEKICPICTVSIKTTEKTCRFCGHEFSEILQ